MASAMLDFAPTLGPAVPKKTARPIPGQPAQPVQVNIKLRSELAERFCAVADALGLDLANFARTVIAENLHVYEGRVEQAKAKRRKPDAE